MLLTLAIAAICYMILPCRYTAEASVWLGRTAGEGGPARADKGSDDPIARETELRVLTSRELATRVVDGLGLQNVRGVGQPRSGPTMVADAAHRQAVGALQDGMKLRAPDRSDAVTVSFAAEDAVMATGVVNRLVDSYVADRRDDDSVTRRRKMLQTLEVTAREAMIRSGAAAEGYKAATALSGQNAAAIARSEMDALNVAFTATISAQRAAKRRLVALAGAANNDRGLQGNIGPGAQIGGPNEPASEVRRLTGTNEVRRLTGEVRIARERARLLEVARARARRELSAQEAAVGELARLERAAADARAKHSEIVNRMKDQALSPTVDQRRLPYVISHAQPQFASVSPNPWLFALGSLITAIAVTAGIVLVLESRQKGFRTAQGLEKALRLPVVAVVPRLPRQRGAGAAAADRMAAPDFLYNNQHSAFSAAFRDLYTGLRLGRGEACPRVLAICSALPEEGKTTVSICLMRSAAMAGLRVVLLDCDARRPAASRTLAPHIATGMAEVLEDATDHALALRSDTASGARFIGQSSGRTLKNGVVSSPAMSALITRLKGEYDLVILDTPPTLALVEARELAAMADSVLLVARYRKTPTGAIAIAQDLLKRAGAPPMAATLTLVEF